MHSIGSDICGCMSERQLKKYIKQHISQPQVETSRWSSQCQAAWCRLIWRATAAAAAVRDEAQNAAADLEALLNSTMRRKGKKKTKQEQWRSIFLRPAVCIYRIFHSLPKISTVSSKFSILCIEKGFVHIQWNRKLCLCPFTFKLKRVTAEIQGAVLGALQILIILRV